ncbi:hypothetical protein VULLAG_LOCUS18818 [Vulpes lagopus]
MLFWDRGDGPCVQIKREDFLWSEKGSISNIRIPGPVDNIYFQLHGQDGQYRFKTIGSIRHMLSGYHPQFPIINRL